MNLVEYTGRHRISTRFQVKAMRFPLIFSDQVANKEWLQDLFAVLRSEKGEEKWVCPKTGIYHNL